MNRADALQIAEQGLKSYRALSYNEILGKVGLPESFERTSKNGEPYRIEFDFFYDDAKRRTFAWSEWFLIAGGQTSSPFQVISLSPQMESS